MKKSSVIFRLLLLAVIVFLSASLAGHVSAQDQKQIEYLSPCFGAQLVSPGTTIVFRSGEYINEKTVDSKLFNLVGSKSGRHEGLAVLSDDQRTVIFKPTVPFALGENVKVDIGAGIQTMAGQSIGPIASRFTTSVHGSASLLPYGFSSLDEGGLVTPAVWENTRTMSGPHYATVPADFPTITVTTPASGTADGYVFISPFPGVPATTSYLIIADNSGQPIYYEKLGLAADFKVQSNGLLTYWEGIFTAAGIGGGTYYAMDNSYKIVDTYQAGNGYQADLHDLQLLPNGHALLIIYDNQTVDMSQIAAGGNPSATVTGLIVQELDTLKNVVFEWRSWDHFLITDTYVSLTTPLVDYVHGNAVEVDTDGNLLVSSRHLSEITKISRQTGDIIWRLGGKNNQFTFVNDTPPYFDYQHDIRRLPNGNITLFDNRTNLSPEYSRAIEYELDEETKIATLAWEYRNTPDTYAVAMGNIQRLSNGSSLIGWGTGQQVTEVKPDGTKAFELALGSFDMSYRAFRYPWRGYPTTQPALVSQIATSTVTLTYSWNGATDIAYYRIYAGDDPHSMTLVGTQIKRGFETQTILPGNSTGCRYFRVMPVDILGRETRYSNDVTSCKSYYFPIIFK